MTTRTGNDEDNGVVQEDDGVLVEASDLTSLVQDHFPPVLHAFGYGSGVFPQQNKADPGSQSQRMIDMILVVDSAASFHRENLRHNPQHYSTRHAAYATWLTKAIPAHVFFLPDVEVQHKMSNGNHVGTIGSNTITIKYGVVEKADLMDDLNDWKYLYLAGRLHKPTLSLMQDVEIREAQQERNLPAAVCASLLLMQSNGLGDHDDHKGDDLLVSCDQVFQQIAKLSYSGDPRVSLGGEDPNKIRKLVHGPGQFGRFLDLYRPILRDLSNEGLLSVVEKNDSNSGSNSSIPQIQWNPQEANDALWKKLPGPLQSNDRGLAVALRQTVFYSASCQMIKGILTAGVTRSTRYVFAKLSKGVLKR